MHEDEGEGDDQWMQEEAEQEQEPEQPPDPPEPPPQQPVVPPLAHQGAAPRHEPHLDRTVHEAAARACADMDRRMRQDGMDPAARQKIEDFAELSRRAMLAYLSPQQRQALGGLAYTPAQPQQGEPRRVNPSEWDRSKFDAGSMYYINRIVALRQLAYAHLAMSATEVPDVAAVADMVRDCHARRVPPVELSAHADVVVAARDMEGWRHPLARYASALTPRPLEHGARGGATSGAVLYGVHLEDSLRIRCSFHQDAPPAPPPGA